MKIIAFGASPSRNSITKIATYAAGLFENGVVEVLDFKCVPDATL
jgi:NAD(P)H-dependent FMN reductase